MNASLDLSALTPLRHFPLAVELSVAAGETLALVGPSGAGKSSLLRIVAGLMTPRSGRIILGEEIWLDTTLAIDLPAERRRCGMVFQEYALFPRMSAWRNVAYGMRLPRRLRRAAAIEMLDRFGLAELADAPAEALSGGERQRVALARALAIEPRVLLLDEPLAALDTATRRSALRRLSELLDDLSLPAVLVTHSFQEAALLAERLAIIDHGLIVQVGTPAEISARPQTPFVADFAGAVVLRGQARGVDGGLTLIQLDGGGEVRSVDPARGRVAVSVFPWEISLEPIDRSHHDSMLNRVAGEVTSVITIGNRARVAIALPQPLSVEITARSAREMDLRPGRRVTAVWKAAATHLIALR